jgi:Tfp pilus assembly protein PilV
MNAKLQRGVSLVEALVALAVMAFGMLGLVGMQATMRSNSDIAKQRSEAVRLAQANIEAGRTYTLMADYDALVNSSGNTDGANATFAWRVDVPASQASPALKTLIATASWTDRLGVTQSVQLQTHLAGTPPELGAALGTPAAGGPTHKPLGRNPAIPPGAVDQGDGSSRFEPPGTNPPNSAGWVFDNTTGFIVKLCDATYTSCTTANLLLLSGYVRFSDSAPPDSEIPNGGGVIPVGVLVNQTLPSTATILCAVSAPTSGYVAYYCPLPISTTTFRWSGQSLVYDGATPSQIATSASDVAVDHYRVCRYTPTAASGNAAHPAAYSDVNVPLSNQNFLMVPAGNGSTATTCPGDNTSTPYVDGTTVLHQPVAAP